MIYVEDCRETLNRNLEYDYVLTSPPDFFEINEDKDLNYCNFVDTWAHLLNPKGNFVSICISDRKYKGEVLSKHSQVIDSFKKLGYKLHTHKLWIKGLGTNMFRMNYQHLLTFSRKGQTRKLKKELLPDCHVIENQKYANFSFGMPIPIVELLIDSYTDEGATVYDPFMGSGTTAVASRNLNRCWIGSEISEEYANMVRERTRTSPLTNDIISNMETF